MAGPAPHTGLVIHYDYLWDSEKRKGRSRQSIPAINQSAQKDTKQRHWAFPPTNSQRTYRTRIGEDAEAMLRRRE